MAGLGRRTHYRKHLTDKVLHDFPVPSQDECIAKVVATRGGNQFDILVASTRTASSSDKNSSSKEATTSTTTRTPQLALLPTKFRKLVWLKRNDFVIVQTGGTDNDDDDDQDNGKTKKETGGGIRYIINHILYKDQIKHLRSKGMWPSHDEEFADTSGAAALEWQHPDNAEHEKVADDGIVYEQQPHDITHSSENEEEEDDDDDDFDKNDMDADLFVNTNRIVRLALQDSSSSSESEDDD